MRGLYSSKTEIRHKIFTEIARMAYEGQSPEMLEELPYKIVPGEIATYRDSIFLERAVVGERLRVAMGMSLSMRQFPKVWRPALLRKSIMNRRLSM